MQIDLDNSPTKAKIMWQRKRIFYLFILFGFVWNFADGVLFGQLGARKYLHGATAVGNRYALFGGGYTVSGPPGYQVYATSTTVDVWDKVTQNWFQILLSEGRGYLASISVGKYALFAGGWRSTIASDYSNVVDIWYFFN